MMQMVDEPGEARTCFEPSEDELVPDDDPKPDQCDAKRVAM